MATRGCHVEKDCHLGRQDGDFRQIRCIRVDIDRGIGKQQGAVFLDDQVKPGDTLDPFRRGITWSTGRMALG